MRLPFPTQAYFDANRHGDITAVIGTFPGRPATFTFSFRFAGDRIADLEIGA